VAAAAALSLPVVGFPVEACGADLPALPAGPGAWVPAGAGVWASGWRWVPAPALF
jgi:hypothetical protein